MTRYNLNVNNYAPVNVILRVATPVDEFYFDTISPQHCTEAIVSSNPLYVIFNQKRLSQLGEFPLQEWIDSMNSIQSDPLKELRSKVKDEDLINVMKSRYCQKPSELAQWSAFLADKMDTLNKDIQDYLKSKESFNSDSETVDKSTDVESQ